ncbi:MAG: EpsG family protein [Ruminococcus sp.]|nr:EpsG family protein [Ruminococcus sp.]
MIIHFSILLVIAIVSVIWESRIRSYAISVTQNNNVNLKAPIIPWTIIFGYLSFLAGMRTSVNDSGAYRTSFQRLPATLDHIKEIWSGDGKDKGFDTIAAVFKVLVSDNYHAWFLFFAIIESILLIAVLRKYSVSLWDGCFFFFVSSLYFNYFSMMRQWMAVVILFYASKFIIEEKPVQYIITCCLAAQLHSSAYLFIIVYFLVRGKAWSNKQNLILIAFSIGMVFFQPILSIMDTTLSDTTYDYVIDIMQSNSGSSIIRAFITIIPVIISYIDRDKLEGKMINLCVNMSLITFMLNLLASFTSGLYIIRLSVYTEIFNVILYPYLLNRTISDQNRKIIKPVFYLLYLTYYLYQMNRSGSFYYGSDILGNFN